MSAFIRRFALPLITRPVGLLPFAFVTSAPSTVIKRSFAVPSATHWLTDWTSMRPSVCLQPLADPHLSSISATLAEADPSPRPADLSGIIPPVKTYARSE